MQKLFLFGAGGHCKQVIDIFKQDTDLTICGIFDDYSQKKDHYGYPILGTINNAVSLSNIYGDARFFCTIGDNIFREKICSQFDKTKFINCIHPKSNISDSVKIGLGNYIGAFTNILGDSVIGDFNILNDGAQLPHDSLIGNYNHVSINASLGGNVRVGNYNLIGLNSTILPKITIGDNITVGAGTVVHRDIKESCTVVGNPYRIIKKN